MVNMSTLQNTQWQETKHGLYRQFVFHDFHEAWAFMERVAAAANRLDHHPRWQNEWNVVDIWLSTHDEANHITDADWELANTIDTLVEEPSAAEMEAKVDKNTTKITEVQLYADGGSRGNPGPSASGYALLDMSNQVVVRTGEYIGVTTNNQAEYQALKLGLERALHEYHAREVQVYMDSMLVINQMKGIFKVKNRDLWPIHDSIKELVKKVAKVSFDHVPRELNKIADEEVNKALDEALKGQ
jgi:ribonuclease HI/pterin-4a-carbinolamine dehydratase